MKPKGVLVEMAVQARKGTDPLFRSVSPWELEDIIRKGAVIGKGSWFSGDKKRTGQRVWFGDTLSDVEGHGRDWRRYIESTDEFRRAFRVKSAIEDARRELRGDGDFFSRTRQPKWQRDGAAKLSKLFYTFQEKLFKKMDQILKRVNKRKQKGTAGYVIEVEGISGGTRYSDADSLAGRRSATDPSSPPEIAVPVWHDAIIRKNARITEKHITRIHAFDAKGKLLKVYERPSSGWNLNMFGKGAKPVDVKTTLGVVDRLTTGVENRFHAAETKIRRDEQKYARERDAAHSRRMGYR